MCKSPNNIELPPVQLIRSGEIDDAFNKLRNWYPQIVQVDEYWS